jgi:PAS domain S-box-containing protein
MKRRILRLQASLKRKGQITRAALHRSEQRYKELLEQAADGIFLLDENGNFLIANPEICKMLGYAPEELLRLNILDTYQDEYRDVGKARLDKIKSGEKLRIERSMVRKDKSVFLIEMSERRLADGTIHGIAHDISDRHKAEEALRRSEQRYRDLMEQGADGIFVLDEHYRFLMANPEFCKMIGYSSGELLGLTILDTYPEELRNMAKARNDRIKSGERLRFERVIKRKDGSVFPVEMSARRLADGTLQGIAHDITERHSLMKKLETEKDLLLTLIDSLPDLVFAKNRYGRFILVNRSLVQFAGASHPRELIGKSDHDFTPAELAEKYAEDDRRVLESAQSLINTEELSTFSSGSSRWVLTTKVPLVDKEGNVTGLVGISRDITEKKQAEQLLASLARFPDENPQPILRVTPDGLILYSNKASEPLTDSWARGTERRIPEKYLPEITLAWETRQNREIEFHESSRTYAVSVVPFIDSGYINVYGRDVTEERALAEKLTQAQKMEAIGQLTGGIAHDFNNILQAITGYCELLYTKVPEANRKIVAEIMKAANRAAALTAQLLAFSRKQVLRPQVVSAEELVHSIRKMLERVIGEDIELITLTDPQAGSFIADPGQMEQVLLNLAVNARDAMPSGGKLIIETTSRTFDEEYVRGHPGAAEGPHVCIAVSDTGVGMDQETLSHIYEPFFTTKGLGKGTGLGLSTVFGIVKQSNGYINCYSEVGKGSTFTIYLPRASQQDDNLQDKVPETNAPRGSETILLVDDDSSVRTVTRMALQEAGYVVFEASGGEEALSEVLSHKITVALLVTDIVMPRMSGKELAHKLQEIFPMMKVLYVSGYTADVISHHGILDTHVDYLQKPFRAFDFLTKVREILDRPNDLRH